MFTGYFGKVKTYPSNLKYVSIAKFARFWSGSVYTKLAPSPELLEIKDAKEYTYRYKQEVLTKLDPRAVYEDLGNDAVLLCYEKWDDIKTGKSFCHRRIVAQWLEEHIEGLSVRELE